MSEAKVRSEWAQTASVMAMLANCHRGSKKDPVFKPADFDPFTKRIKPPKVKMAELKPLLMGRSGKSNKEEKR
ncbi:MAG: hypothetical protein KJ057_09830 [Phycisphaerae bacterium]|nr:hypothetical protein [Phycisphaerae bacterium]